MKFQMDLTPMECDQVLYGAKQFKWKGNYLFVGADKQMSASNTSPKTMSRLSLTCSLGVGPFCSLNDLQLILSTLLVARYVTIGLLVCAQRSLNSPTFHLQPLPIIGLVYQYRLDFAAHWV